MDLNSGPPKLAVIIPAYKQPGLLPEAVISALNQDIEIPFRIIIVNDGCPFPETHHAAKILARAHPEQISYLYTQNRGLSAARNAGIHLALSTWPSLDAFLFLDADNRLRPNALRNAYTSWLSQGRPGWIFSDIEVFGIRGFAAMSGEYSVLEHSLQNICDAGSLVNRSVLDAGVRFDDSMKEGYEDWEFWLQAASKGFRGAYAPRVGLLYRKRPESMLRDSARSHAEILGYIRRKHSRLFQLKSLLVLEHQEHPRYAFCTDSGADVSLATDPRQRQRTIDLDALAEDLALSYASPEFRKAPAFLLFATQECLTALDTCGLTNGVLWLLENETTNKQASGMVVRRARTEEISLDGDRATADPDVIMIHSDWFRDILHTSAVEVVSAIRNSRCMVQLNVPSEVQSTDSVAAIELAVNFCDRLKTHHDKLSRLYWPKHYSGARLKGPAVTQRLREVSSSDALFPIASHSRAVQVGFCLPMASFGGVERVVCNYAKVLAEGGGPIHICLYYRGNHSTCQRSFCGLSKP